MMAEKREINIAADALSSSPSSTPNVEPRAASEPSSAEPVAVPENSGRAAAGDLPQDAAAQDAARDGPESGRELAEHMLEAGYQPVVIFGNAASGKTSLLLSLFATLRTEARLEAALFPGPVVMDTSRPYGRYIAEQASQFFGLKTQQFIEGVASPKTNIELPFFIPVCFRPAQGPEVRFAFMESNGEWYRPDRNTVGYYPPLRKQIAEFLAHFSAGVIFIHLIPYTQKRVHGADDGSTNDAKLLREAQDAIAGALQAYDRSPRDKSNDYHILLVSKWDAHKGEGDYLDSLYDDPVELEDFVAGRYPDALNIYKRLGLNSAQIALNGYSAGQISDQDVVRLVTGERRDAYLRYPVGLWRWLYQNALAVAGEPITDPFPPEKSAGPLAEALNRLLHRFF
jgi:hypothetical protein